MSRGNVRLETRETLSVTLDFLFFFFFFSQDQISSSHTVMVGRSQAQHLFSFVHLVSPARHSSLQRALEDSRTTRVHAASAGYSTQTRSSKLIPVSPMSMSAAPHPLPPLTTSDPRSFYTIVVSGENFPVTLSAIQYDSPNFFSESKSVTVLLFS